MMKPSRGNYVFSVCPKCGRQFIGWENPPDRAWKSTPCDRCGVLVERVEGIVDVRMPPPDLEDMIKGI